MFWTTRSRGQTCPVGSKLRSYSAVDLLCGPGKLLDFSEPVFSSVKWDTMLSEGNELDKSRLIQWEFCLVFGRAGVLMKLVAKAG